MASRFDQYAPVGPVHLPIEAYRASALINEQKTQQDLDLLQQTMASYDAITPFSKNPEAVYQNTMKDLRSRANELAKQNLKTPDAKRAIKKLVSDPGIIRNLKNVMMDSMYASQRQKERAEYLKKNPSTNTYVYNRVFDEARAETGDPSQFNPSRFVNMDPLVDYVDVDKIITEGVGKLKEDKQKVKEILKDGTLYYEWERNGLHEDKIRKHVANELMHNPLVSEQVNRNIESAIYNYDHLDRNNGVMKMATDYRRSADEHLQSTQMQIGDNIQRRIAKLTAANEKIAKKLRPDIRTVLATDKKLAGMRKDFDDANDLNGMYTDPDHPKYKDDEHQIREIYLNSLVNGYDQFAHTDTVDKWSFTELARAQWDAATRMRLARYKAQKLKETLSPVEQGVNRFNLPLSQDAVKDQDMKSVIGRIPELASVVPFITKHGGLEIPKTEIETGTGFVDDMKRIGTGLYDNVYLPGKDIVTGDTTTRAYNKPQQKYTAADLEKTKTTLRNYLIKHGSSDVKYNGFKTENDVRDAVQDIAINQQLTESNFNPTYTIAQSGDPAMRQKFNYGAVTNGLFDNDNNPIDPANRDAIIKHINETKGVIGVTPTLRGNQSEQSFWSGAGPDGKMYHTIMDDGNNRMMAPARNTAKMGMRTDMGMMPNNDGSLSIMELGKGGHSRGINIPLAATPEYQKTAQAYFDHNLEKVMALGYNKEDATTWLNSRYDEMHDQIVKQERAGMKNKPAVLTSGKGGSVEIYVPVKKRGEAYYSEFPLIDSQAGGRPIMDMNSYMENHVLNFSKTSYNPYMFQASENKLRAKTKETTVIGDYLNDDEEDIAPINYGNYQSPDEED